MKTQIKILVLVVATLAVACSDGSKTTRNEAPTKKAEASVPTTKLTKTLPKEKLVDLKKVDMNDPISIMSQSSLVCAEGQTCPKNIAGVLVWGGWHEEEASEKNGNQEREMYKIANCSGFLVNDHLLATNKHCVIDIDPKDCSQAMVMDFIDGSKRTCKSIYFDSSEDIDMEKFVFNRDLALVELDKPVDVGLVELAISKKGFTHKESVRIVKVDHDADITKPGIVKNVNCRILESAIFNLTYGPDNIAYPTAYDCSGEVSNGNSGSMMLGEDGELKAIVFAAAPEWNPDNRPQGAENMDFSRFGKKGPPEYSTALNFACIDIETDGTFSWSTELKCNSNYREVATDVLVKEEKRIMDASREGIDKAIERNIQVMNRYSYINFVPQGHPQGLNQVPVCFIPDAYKEELALSGKDQLPVLETLPVFEIRIVNYLDDDYRLQARVANKKVDLDYVIESEALGRTIRSPGVYLNPNKEPWKIKDCPAEVTEQYRVAMQVRKTVKAVNDLMDLIGRDNIKNTLEWFKKLSQP